MHITEGTNKLYWTFKMTYLIYPKANTRKDMIKKPLVFCELKGFINLSKKPTKTSWLEKNNLKQS